MTTLTDFLLARIAEDEAVAQAADSPDFRFDLDGKSTDAFAHIARHDRALAGIWADHPAYEAEWGLS